MGKIKEAPSSRALLQGGTGLGLGRWRLRQPGLEDFFGFLDEGLQCTLHHWGEVYCRVQTLRNNAQELKVLDVFPLSESQECQEVGQCDVMSRKLEWGLGQQFALPEVNHGPWRVIRMNRIDQEQVAGFLHKRQ